MLSTPRTCRAARSPRSSGTEPPLSHVSSRAPNGRAAGRRAALLELGGAHGDCLYAQALVLSRAGWSVQLVCGERLSPYIPGLETVVERVELLEPDAGAVSHWRRLLRLRRLLRELDVDLIALNTAQGRAVRDFFLLPGTGSIPVVGLLHQVDKLSGSFTQRLISPHVDGYFLLDDHLLSLAPADTPTPLAAFYPIFFPDPGRPPAEDDAAGADSAWPGEKPPAETWIAVPGTVEFRRRDYPALWELEPTLSRHPDIRVIVLGRCDPNSPDGARLLSELAARGLSERFVMFEAFVPPPAFHAWLSRCDVVMPLLHARRPEFAHYENRRVSFAFHVAAGWRLPLLADRWFERLNDYVGNTIFYDPTRLGRLLDDLPAKLDELRETAFRGAKWTLEEQTGRYLELLERAGV